MLIAMCCAAGKAPSFDGEHFSGRTISYGAELGRRLPMTAFEELLLNETRGKRSILVNILIVNVQVGLRINTYSQSLWKLWFHSAFFVYVRVCKNIFDKNYEQHLICDRQRSICRVVERYGVHA